MANLQSLITRDNGIDCDKKGHLFTEQELKDAESIALTTEEPAKAHQAMSVLTAVSKKPAMQSELANIVKSARSW